MSRPMPAQRIGHPSVTSSAGSTSAVANLLMATVLLDTGRSFVTDRYKRAGDDRSGFSSSLHLPP